MLAWLGWKPIYPAVYQPKSIVAVAPHTSNYDFFIGYIYYKSLGSGQRPRFLIKKEWFFFPLNYIFKALGGLPVDRSSGASTVDQAIDLLKKADHLHIGVTPEGTRSRAERWKTGFYRMALLAKVPIELAKIDYKNKEIGIIETIQPHDGDIDDAINEIRSHFSKDMARFPQQFVDLNEKSQ